MEFIRCSYDTGILLNTSCAQVQKIGINKISKEFEEFTKLFDKPEDDDALPKQKSQDHKISL